MLRILTAKFSLRVSNLFVIRPKQEVNCLVQIFYEYISDVMGDKIYGTERVDDAH